MVKFAALSAVASTPSRVFLTVRTQREKIAGYRPEAPSPWKDEYPALVYGANCPQTLHNYKSIEMSFLYDWDDGYMSEDMLKLNIWAAQSFRPATCDGVFPRRRIQLRFGVRTALA